MPAYMMKNQTKLTDKDSPYLTLLAAMLLLFSLYLLSCPLAIDVMQTPAQQNKHKEAKQQEHLVRLLSLPEKKPDTAPKVEPAVVSAKADKSASKGKKPAIDATFSMPVQQYVQILQQRSGAKLILFDAQHGRVIGEVSGMKLTPGNTQLHGMSLRARDITADLPSSFRKSLRAQADGKPYKFLIVLPRQAEQQFEKRLENQLLAFGVPWSAISSMKLRYEQSGMHIKARVESVNINGTVKQVGTTIEIW